MLLDRVVGTFSVSLALRRKALVPGLDDVIGKSLYPLAGQRVDAVVVPEDRRTFNEDEGGLGDSGNRRDLAD